MQLYSVSDEYISYLRKNFPRVYSNKEDTRVHTRKYLGAVIEIDSHKYYIPLSSPKDKHEKNIIKNARVLYSKRKSGEQNRVVQSCLDFIALEKECDKWMQEKGDKVAD